jgi:hypothetical protein
VLKKLKRPKADPNRRTQSAGESNMSAGEDTFGTHLRRTLALLRTQDLTIADTLYLVDTDHVIQSDEVGVFFVGATKRIRCTVTQDSSLRMRFLEPGTGKRYNSLSDWLEARNRRSKTPYSFKDIGFGKVKDGHLLVKGRLTFADIGHRLETLLSVHTHSPKAFKRLVLRYKAIQADTYDWTTDEDDWGEEEEDSDDGEWTTMWAELEDEEEEEKEKEKEKDRVKIGKAVAL